MQIITENLTYIYSEKSKSLNKKALDNLSLTIEEGDFYGIIGKTGSGKSTFLQHLNGLIKVGKDKGFIKIGDFDLTDKKCDFKSLRAKVGMVFQYPEYQLFAETVYSDVAFGVKNFYPDIKEDELNSTVKEALELVGLNYERVKDRSPFDMSGGQKRRIAIAGVIAFKPEILILDEPAAGLDPKGKKDFLNLIKTLHQKFVKTVVIVSHDMNIISEYCDKVAIISNGKIYKKGTPKEVFALSNEELQNLGLEFPLTAYLTEGLKKKGIDVNSNLKVDDFIDKLCLKLKGEK